MQNQSGRHSSIRALVGKPNFLALMGENRDSLASPNSKEGAVHTWANTYTNKEQHMCL